MERAKRGFPLAAPARFVVLRALCAIAEGATVLVPVTVTADIADLADAEAGTGFGASKSAKCVAAVLGDAQRRLCVMGGREGMPRSLGSLFGYFVARFVGSSRGGVRHHVLPMPGPYTYHCSIAVTRDGTTLLVSDYEGGSHSVHAFSVHTGEKLRTIGCIGSMPLQFRNPCQVWVASDDYVFVADCDNNRIQVLTPRDFDFHSFVGEFQIRPVGVCADEQNVFVSEARVHRISVFRRGNGALLRRFGSQGSDNGQLHWPLGLCFMSENRHIAVADWSNNRISVFSLEGEFVRSVGVGKLHNPSGVACSAFDELVVADYGNRRVVVFSASGEVLYTMEHEKFISVAMHGDAIFAQTLRDGGKCVVFT